ncbi:MAG TPA: LysM peptidoglycan-binding domain-containing protein [Thermoanaerobaculia bacterium]|nr:LysM peptidoglycan-binding domain-containing protein [Thermoanaerobaculia bacterium]
MNGRQISLIGILLALLLSPAGPAQGQAAPPEAGAAWYTVRPGDTLETIAARFLGTSQRWQEIHRLNEGILDPDRIEPGLRIRMPGVRSALPAAQLNRISRRVEAKPSPISWNNAQVGDVLVEHDGVRTYQKSSAEMRFLDGGRLVVTEDSLVFLRRSGSRLKGVERKAIEIVEGQADLEGRTAGGPARAPEVEIILGGTRATSKPGPAGTSQARARKAAGGGAKVMVYGGEGEVEAGGTRVQVAEGMGTSVEAQGPPSPPEKLLPAPRLADPAPGSERACADPMISWEPVPEAASYTVEVCRDPGCGELVERQTGQAGPPWRPAALPMGGLYWRVTARSRSGLDGYPSEAAALRITSEKANLPAPSGSLRVTGPQVRVGERLIVAPAAQVEVTATDANGAPARWVPVIGGREETAWPTAWSAGEQVAEAIALDGCGNRGPLEPVAFVVDTEPPVLHWQTGNRDKHEGRLAPDSESDRRRLKGRRSGGKAARDAWASDAGVWQLPLPWVKLKPGVRPAEFPVTITSDQPQAFLAAPGSELAVDGKVVTLGEGILRVAAEDAGAGVDRLVLKTRTEGDRMVLEVEAFDLVGNVSRKEITVGRMPAR